MEITKIRVKGSQVRIPSKDSEAKTSYYNEGQESKELKIKHLEIPCRFVEDEVLYDLVIADYDDKDFEVLKYRKRDGMSEFFRCMKPIKEKAGEPQTVQKYCIGLISRKAVDLLFLTNV